MYLSAEELFKEYGRMISDRCYAIESYLYTFDKTREGIVPFKLFPKQKEVVEGLENFRYNLFTKPRQAGISTTVAAEAAFRLALADSKNPEAILILANKQELAQEFLSKIQEFLTQVPRWLWGNDYYGSEENEAKSIFLTDSKKEKKLPNGSRVKAVATSKDALRGFAPTYLIMDEAAFIEQGAEVYGNAMASMSTGGKVSLISCVTKDTFIFTDKGLRQVEDFINFEKPINPKEGYFVDSYNIRGNLKNRTSNIMVNNGYHKTLKIHTPNSYIEGTKTHKVWAYSNRLEKYDWFKLEELELGDFLNLQYGYNLFGEYVIETPYVTGLYCGENGVIEKELLSLNKEDIKLLILGVIHSNETYLKISKNKITIRNKSNLLLRQLQMLFLNFGLLSELNYDKLIIKNINNINDLFDKEIFYKINIPNKKLITEENIDRIIIPNSKWVKIKKIEPSENYTYDFSLYEDKNDFWCHSVLYNGILGHQTPNGFDPLYYKTYEQSKAGKNDYNIVELKWYQDPRYNKDLQWVKDEQYIDEIEFTIESYDKMIKQGYKPTSTWYRDMCRSMNNDAKKIAQELDVSFIGSGGSVIAEEHTTRHLENYVEDPIFIDKKYLDEKGGEVWVWEVPQEGCEYVLASDVARGDGEDYSTMTIINKTNMTMAAEYAGFAYPDTLAQIIEDYGTKYNAYAVVDITGGMGTATVLKLLEMQYPSIHYDNPKVNVLAKKNEIEKYRDVKTNKIPGFHIGANRSNLIAHFEYMIRTDALKIKSVRVINELNTFIYKNGKPDHMSGYHDDCIFSLAMALWVIEHTFNGINKAKEMSKAVLSSWFSSGSLNLLDKSKYNNENNNKPKKVFIGMTTAASASTNYNKLYSRLFS